MFLKDTFQEVDVEEGRFRALVFRGIFSSHLEALTRIDQCLLILPSAHEPAPPMAGLAFEGGCLPPGGEG